MTTAARRSLRMAVLAMALLPAVLALALVRPVSAASPLGFYALTYAAAAVAPQGEIGAGGGLLPIDGGAPLVRGRVESAPSSSSVAASVEPGTLFSTIAGVANTEAGEEVIATPTRAEALYPGAPEGSANQFGPEQAGPLSVGLGTALAQARLHGATGRAELSTYRLSGGEASSRALAAQLATLRVRYPAAATVRTAESDGAALAVDGGSAFGQAAATPEQGALAVEARTSVDEVRVADQVVIRGISGRASVSVADGTRTPQAGLEIASAAVGPFPVVVTADGVEFAGQGIPAAQAQELSAAINDALAAAGVRVHLEPARSATADGAAEADSGALYVSVQTPSDGGIPGNTFGAVLGRANVTSADEPPLTSVWQSPGLLPAPGPGPVNLGTVGPLSQQDALAPAPAPADAGTPVPPRMIMVAGRAIPASAALAAFAVWQLLSLSTSTLAALVLRNREGAA
jgi:hypothetical protein